MSTRAAKYARPARARQPWLLWVLAALVLLKAAVPLLAADAARRQGVAVADICSVVGVRLAGPADAPGAPAGMAHDTGEHCVLTPLLGAAPLAAVIGLPARPAALALTTEVIVDAIAADARIPWSRPLAQAPPEPV